MSNVKKLMMTAAGGAGLNVEDVFSTYLYAANNAAQTITNGIDLAGEGGLVWGKSRSAAQDPRIYDTEGNGLYPNYVYGGFGQENRITFNNNGFSLGTSSGLVGGSGYGGPDYASWTFRKAPKFFDVVTYTGDGVSGRQIAHNLGCDVGMLVVKGTSVSNPWSVWHNDFTGTAKYMTLNSADQAYTNGESRFGNGSTYINPTSSNFTVGTALNDSGETYVAYLFAHNDGDGEFGPNGDQDIIKCGSYTGNGSDTGPNIDLGFEPQWLMIKRTDSSANWYMFDNMRGVASGYDRLDDDGYDSRLLANTTGTENNLNNFLGFRSNGFEIDNANGDINANNGTYVYIAIRRGPMAVPENASDVFALDGSQSSTEPSFSSSFPVDFGIMYSSGTNSQTPWWFNRLTGTKILKPITATAESTDTTVTLDHMDGWGNRGFSSTDYQSHMFRRAPNFMDVVAYKGLGGNQSVPHNLGATPEFIIIKNRELGFNWKVKHTGMGLKETTLNGTAAESVSDYWQSGDDADVFYTRSSNDNYVNGTSYEYIAYMFASLDGVSKVGSYTGNGSGSGQNQTIDCGFASTPRLVVIKNVSRYRYWYYWDSLTGIVAGSEERNYWNRYQVDSALDLLDPTSSGFTANWNSAADESMNNSGEKYIYLAIA